MEDKEWYTIEELAAEFGVGYQKVRQAVQVLAKTGNITTRDKPGDNRVTEVRKDSIPTVKVASL